MEGEERKRKGRKGMWSRKKMYRVEGCHSVGGGGGSEPWNFDDGREGGREEENVEGGREGRKGKIIREKYD